jgi:hypothetical protein
MNYFTLFFRILLFINFAEVKDHMPLDYDDLASEIFHCKANITREQITTIFFLHLKFFHFLLNDIHYFHLLAHLYFFQGLCISILLVQK